MTMLQRFLATSSRAAGSRSRRCSVRSASADARSAATDQPAPEAASRRKVVVVGPLPPPYHGVAVMTRTIVASLSALGALAAHLDTRDPRPIATIGRLDARNVLLGLRHAGKLHQILRADRHAEVLLPISQGTWGFLRDAVLILVTRLHRRRLVLHLHGGGLTEFYGQSSWPMRWLLRAVFSQAAEAWALTPGLRAQFHGLLPPSRVKCVANVVDDTLLGERADTRPDLPRHGLRVLFLSNLLPDKGCFDVVAAVGLLDGKASGWEVRLAGQGEDAVADRLRRAIADLPPGVADVRVVGAVDDGTRASQYRWADVFLYPTRYPPEGQPLVLLEAMAAGLPIVTTGKGGIRDTVRHEVEGLLVPEGDIRGIGRALYRLASDVALRASLGHSARRRYEACYRPQRLVQDLTRLLRP
jgi:glycosyltransferase involved in cell wall biosynthesis